MKCLGCGNNIFDNAVACPYCGRLNSARDIQPVSNGGSNGAIA